MVRYVVILLEGGLPYTANRPQTILQYIEPSSSLGLFSFLRLGGLCSGPVCFSSLWGSSVSGLWYSFKCCWKHVQVLAAMIVQVFKQPDHHTDHHKIAVHWESWQVSLLLGWVVEQGARWCGKDRTCVDVRAYSFGGLFSRCHMAKFFEAREATSFVNVGA